MKRLFAVTLMAAAFALPTARSNAQDAKKNAVLTPVSNQNDKNWIDRHTKLLEIASKGDVDVLFLGDSITERWANNSAWKKSFAPLKAANFGIGGDRIEHLLWTLPKARNSKGSPPKWRYC